MAAHQCPYCALGFQLRPVLEYHVREDHPEVHADYPTTTPTNADWPMAQRPKRYSWRPTYPVRRTP